VSSFRTVKWPAYTVIEITTKSLPNTPHITHKSHHIITKQQQFELMNPIPQLPKKLHLSHSIRPSPLHTSPKERNPKSSLPSQRTGQNHTISSRHYPHKVTVYTYIQSTHTHTHAAHQGAQGICKSWVEEQNSSSQSLTYYSHSSKSLANGVL
jgi:hypothetical protein